MLLAFQFIHRDHQCNNNYDLHNIIIDIHTNIDKNVMHTIKYDSTHSSMLGIVHSSVIIYF